jgi:hypothetical protein
MMAAKCHNTQRCQTTGADQAANMPARPLSSKATQPACRRVSNSLRNTHPLQSLHSTHSHMHTTSHCRPPSPIWSPTTSCDVGVGPLLPAHQQTHCVIPVNTYIPTSTNQKGTSHALHCCRHKAAFRVHVNMETRVCRERLGSSASLFVWASYCVQSPEFPKKALHRGSSCCKHATTCIT